ncbi:MAG: RES domain-containing protein [Oscillospiraceae bacterium]
MTDLIIGDIIFIKMWGNHKFYGFVRGPGEMDDYIFSEVNKKYSDFVRDVISGVETTAYDNIIRDLAPDNIHIGRNIRIGERCVRARKHKNSGEPPFGEMDIGMNKKCPFQGRWNKNGESLFYLCKKRDTAFVEIDSKIGDTVSLGHFIFRQEKKLIDLTGTIWSDSNGIYGGVSAREARSFLLLLVENQCKNQNSEEAYKVTNYLWKLLKSVNIDGIRYNSVHWKQKSDWACFALTSDSGVEWRYTEQWKIENIDRKGHHFCCTSLK